MQEEHRPLNYAGLALAMIVGALGIVAINLYSARDFVDEALLKRARAHFADALVSPRWVRHEASADTSPLPSARSHEIRLLGFKATKATNQPDAWDATALKALVAGAREHSALVTKGDATQYRYLGALYFESQCLRCHAGQGFQPGDVAGAISVAFDASDTNRASRNNAIATGIAILLIMLGVAQVMVFSIRRVRELGRLTDRERARFESLVQTMEGIVWEADPRSLQFSFVSRHAATLMGYPLTDWTRPGFWLAHVHPDDRARVAALRSENARSAEANELEYRFIARDGNIIWVHDRSNLVLEDGKSGVLRGIMIDVTVRKQAEQSAGKLLRAVEQSPVSIIITNRAGVIEYVNPRFTQSFGYARDEVLGRNPRMLKSGLTQPEVYRELWQTVLAGREWHGRLNNLCKNGDNRWEDASIVPVFDDRGEITHFLAVEEDVTDRLRVEKELARYRDKLEDQVRARTEDLVLAMQKATAADRAKTEFLTNMSHEIRTPLNAIIGFCGLALRSQMDDRQRDYLEKIDGAGQHLLQLINNLLDFSKIAAGKVEISTSQFDLPALVERIASVSGYKAGEKGLAFKVVVDPALPRALMGDELRVKQVLLNLVNNAVKFTERGEVRVDVRRLNGDGDFLRIEFIVQDTGIGMDEAELRRAFEPFAQGDASISRKYGGSGLGLSISRELVGLMGGRLEASSAKGEGSRFAFALDFGVVQGAVSSVPEVSEDETYQFVGLKVLLVEDQAMNRQVATEIMASRGIAVVAATNGLEAVEALKAAGADAFDVVLMDLQMPEYDGLWAMRQIRALPSFANLPIVAMTAHVLEEERRRAAAAGANGHLGKPFRPQELDAALARFAPPAKVRRVPMAVVSAEAPAPIPRPTAGALDPEILDWLDGLERFAGREDKYRIWLQRFVEERQGVADQAAQLLVEGKATEAAQLVHALKGVAGMLGLKKAFGAARELEMACRERAGDNPSRDVESELATLRAAVAEAEKVIGALGAAALPQVATVER